MVVEAVSRWLYKNFHLKLSTLSISHKAVKLKMTILIKYWIKGRREHTWIWTCDESIDKMHSGLRKLFGEKRFVSSKQAWKDIGKD